MTTTATRRGPGQLLSKQLLSLLVPVAAGNSVTGAMLRTLSEAAAVAQAAAADPAPAAAAEPTPAQAAAGNYKKGRARLHGLAITIENPKGSTRRGVDGSGKPWSTVMGAHYGYFRGQGTGGNSVTVSGADGDPIDVFIGDHPESEIVFVIDQRIHGTRERFDEHKVIFGARSMDEAKAIYRSCYCKGWKGFLEATPMTVPAFKKWLTVESKHIPARELEKGIDKIGGAQNGAMDFDATPAAAAAEPKAAAPKYDYAGEGGPTAGYHAEPFAGACHHCGTAIKNTHWLSDHAAKRSICVGSECVKKLTGETGEAAGARVKRAAAASAGNAKRADATGFAQRAAERLSEQFPRIQGQVHDRRFDGTWEDRDHVSRSRIHSKDKLPFSKDFNAAVKQIGGSWGGEQWEVPMHQAPKLHALIEQHHPARLSKALDPKRVYHWCNRCGKAECGTGEDCPECGAAMERGAALKDARECPKGHIFDAGDSDARASDEGDPEKCPTCGGNGISVSGGIGEMVKAINTHQVSDQWGEKHAFSIDDDHAEAVPDGFSPYKDKTLTGPGYKMKQGAGLTSSNVDIPKQDGHLYRGMSEGELRSIHATGKLQSNGSMNLPGQDGITCASSSPRQAMTYAHDTRMPAITPKEHQSPHGHTYVVEFKHPGEENIKRVHGPEHEIKGAVPKSSITNVYRMRPYAWDEKGEPRSHGWEKLDDHGAAAVAASPAPGQMQKAIDKIGGSQNAAMDFDAAAAAAAQEPQHEYGHPKNPIKTDDFTYGHVAQLLKGKSDRGTHEFHFDNGAKMTAWKTIKPVRGKEVRTFAHFHMEHPSGKREKYRQKENGDFTRVDYGRNIAGSGSGTSGSPGPAELSKAVDNHGGRFNATFDFEAAGKLPAPKTMDTLPEHHATAMAHIAAFEKQHQGSAVKHAMIVSPHTGQVVWHGTSNQKTHVVMPGKALRHCKEKEPGCYFTQNQPVALDHPKDSPRRAGSSLSTDDLSFAAAHKLGQVRTVTPKYVHVAKPAPGGFGGGDHEDFARQLKAYAGAVSKELNERIAGGNMTRDQAAAEAVHARNTRLHDAGMMHYQRHAIGAIGAIGAAGSGSGAAGDTTGGSSTSGNPFPRSGSGDLFKAIDKIGGRQNSAFDFDGPMPTAGPTPKMALPKDPEPDLPRLPFHHATAMAHILAFEKEHHNKAVEHGIIASPKTGKVLWQGTTNSHNTLDVPKDILEHCRQKEPGCYFSHNHPAGWLHAPDHPRHVGNSLSPGDLFVAAHSKFGQMRAITPTHVHIARPPEGGYPHNWEDLQGPRLAHNEAVHNEFTEKIDSGKITPDQAEAAHHTEVNTRMHKAGLMHFEHYENPNRELSKAIVFGHPEHYDPKEHKPVTPGHHRIHDNFKDMYGAGGSGSGERKHQPKQGAGPKKKRKQQQRRELSKALLLPGVAFPDVLAWFCKSLNPDMPTAPTFDGYAKGVNGAAIHDHIAARAVVKPHELRHGKSYWMVKDGSLREASFNHNHDAEHTLHHTGQMPGGIEGSGEAIGNVAHHAGIVRVAPSRHGGGTANFEMHNIPTQAQVKTMGGLFPREKGAGYMEMRTTPSGGSGGGSGASGIHTFDHFGKFASAIHPHAQIAEPYRNAPAAAIGGPAAAGSRGFSESGSVPTAAGAGMTSLIKSLPFGRIRVTV